MSAFKAGTVFVDVVPSMKGFFKEVAGDVRGQMPQVGAESGREFVEGFRKSVSASGKDLANAVADPLGKSAARLRQEAASAGRALSAAQEGVASSGRALAAAREKEASAAAGLESAEAALNRVRSSGSASASEVSRAEAAYAEALNASKTANSQADTAASAHSRALGKETQAAKTADRANSELAKATGHASQALGQGTQAAKTADRANDALARATGRAKQEANQANPAMRGLSQSVTGVGAQAERAGSRMSSIGSLTRSAVGPVLALGAAVGIGGFASEAITASDATDKFVSTLQFAGVDTSTIDRLKDSAKKYADETVYDLSDIQSITAQLAANNVKDFDRLAEAAGNLNAVAGGSAETFKSVGMVLTQTAGQGKLTTENWNQLSDAIPGASGQLQKALLDAGAYTGNFRDALEKGEVTAEEFNAAVLELGSSETAQAAARSTKTLEGAAGNLQATIVGGFKEMIDYLKPGITDLMNTVSDAISSSIEWIKENKDSLYALAIGVGVAVAAFAALSILQSVRSWIMATTLATEGLNAAMKANIVGIIVTAIAALVTGLVLLYQRNEAFREKVNELGQSVKQIWETYIQPALQAAWEWINGTLIPGIRGIIDLLFTGDFTGPIFGLEEDSGLVDFLLTLREGAIATGTAIAAAWNDYIYPALSALWSWTTGTLAPALQDFWTGVVQPVWSGFSTAVQMAWTYVIYPALSGMWTFVTSVLAPALVAFWTGVVQPVWSAISTAVSVAWNYVIYPALSGMWTWITGTLAPALQSFWTGVVQPVWSAISSAVSAAWGAIQPVLSALWGFISGTLAPALQDFWTRVVQPTWSSIASLIQAAWTNIISPTLSALWSFISGVLGPIIMWLWNNVVVVAWNGIASAIKFAWNYSVKPTWDALSWAISNVLAPVFRWLWNNVVIPVWENISNKISTVVNFLKDTVFPRIKTAIDTAKNGFDNFKSGVEKAMNGIKAAAAKPVNFVINTIYNNGIKKAFDSIAEKVGLSLRLPSVSPIGGYATGGQWRTMTPGYTPGRDVFHFFSPDGGGAIRLSGGEGIIRPDSLRALGGKAWLDRVNASRGRGLATVGDTGPRRGRVAFAEGGIWSTVGQGFSSAAAWVKNTASAVEDIISDPLGAVANLVTAPAKALLAGMESNFWAQTIAAMPPHWLDKLGDLLKSKIDEGGASGATGGGSGLVGAARKAIGVPYVWGGSSIPPGLDCSGLVYWAARQLGWNWPRLTAAGYQSGSRPVAWGAKVPGDLLFWGSPAHHVAIYAGGNRMIEEPHEGASGRDIGIWGSPTVGRYGSGKYDSGGWLPPGVTAAVNRTGAQEAVLTARQWSDVSALAARGSGVDLDALDGIEMHLVLDDGEAFNGHLEVVATRAARRAEVLRGRRA